MGQRDDGERQSRRSPNFFFSSSSSLSFSELLGRELSGKQEQSKLHLLRCCGRLELDQT